MQTTACSTSEAVGTLRQAVADAMQMLEYRPPGEDHVLFGIYSDHLVAAQSLIDELSSHTSVVDVDFTRLLPELFRLWMEEIGEPKRLCQLRQLGRERAKDWPAWAREFQLAMDLCREPLLRLLHVALREITSATRTEIVSFRTN